MEKADLGRADVKGGSGRGDRYSGQKRSRKDHLLPFPVRLHKEHTGGFYWDGTPETDRQRRSRSYLVMQDVNYELFAESVEAECSFGIRNPDRELAETAMKDLGLWPYRDRHPNTLSGGQKTSGRLRLSVWSAKRS